MESTPKATTVLVPKPYPIERIERAQLGKLQANCTEFGPYYAMLKDDKPPETYRDTLIKLRNDIPRMFNNGKKNFDVFYKDVEK